MKRFLPLLAALLASPAAAQPPGPPMGPPPGPPPAHIILIQKAAQDELKLTQKQVAKLRETMAIAMAKFKPPPGGQFPDMEKMKERFDEADRQALAVLEPAQRKRLREITLQAWAPRAFTDAAVAKELGLDDDQQQQMRDLMEKATKDQQKLFAAKGQPAALQKQLAALKKTVTDRTLGVLTTEQRAKWADMTGKAFKGQLQLGPPPPPMGFPPPPGLQGPPR